MAATPTPHTERVAAYDWADGFRTRRVELRRQMSSGERSLSDVLADAATTDDGALKLLFVLESLPGAGKVATRRHLASLGLSETVPLRDLSEDERLVVLREFGADAGARSVAGEGAA